MAGDQTIAALRVHSGGWIHFLSIQHFQLLALLHSALLHFYTDFPKQYSAFSVRM